MFDSNCRKHWQILIASGYICVEHMRLASAPVPSELCDCCVLIFHLCLSFIVWTETAGKLFAEAGGRWSAGYKLYFTTDRPGTAQ